MPFAKGCYSTRLLIRLLLLIALVLSALAVTALANARTSTPSLATVTTLIAHNHADSMPCNGHLGPGGATCRASSNCQPASSCLTAIPPSLPVAAPLNPLYTSAAIARDGIGHIPTPPPPRTSV